MQDAIGNTWARESHLSREMLGSLRELNQQFLDLIGRQAAGRAPEGYAITPEVGTKVMSLSGAQVAAASNCPYSLFNLRFDDDAHWQIRLRDAGPWCVTDEPRADRDVVNFVRLALFYAWHVAASATLAPQLLLGMSEPTVAAFRRVTVDRLPALAASETANLTARWSANQAYWSELTRAAAGADSAGLRRVQLYGLQLAAAARLK